MPSVKFCELRDKNSQFLMNKKTYYPFTNFAVILKIGRYLIDRYSDELFKKEEVVFPDELKGSVKKRRAEYLAGRILAREVLHENGIKNFDVLSNNHRCPIWPNNIVGSISHTSSTVICIGTNIKYYSGIGVDVESVMNNRTMNQIKNLVFDVREMRMLRYSGISIELASTIAFSAKESLFKALYPSVGEYFDFFVVKVINVNLSTGELEFELTSSLSSYLCKGRKFKAYFTRINKYMVLTIVAWKNIGEYLNNEFDMTGVSYDIPSYALVKLN